MTRRLYFARIAAPVFTAIVVPPALAVCSRPQPRLVCAEYANSKAVVVATLRAARHVEPPKLDTDGHVYTLSVKTLIRGEMGSTFQIWEENASGRVAFDWKVGTDYLLFLLRYSREPVGGWLVDGCGNSGPLNKSGAVLRAIEAAQANTSGGSIYGMVSTDSLDTGVPDIIIRAIGQGRRVSARTDQRGRFLLRLPTGKYTVEALRKGWSFGPDVFSYENPGNLSITPGYCAQVQFSGTAKQ
jgi:hypothetical protein